MKLDYSLVLVPILLLVLAPAPAFAYVGPGLGAGAVAAVLGVLGSLFLGLFAVVYYPIKRALRGRRRTVKRDMPNGVNRSPSSDPR